MVENCDLLLKQEQIHSNNHQKWEMKREIIRISTLSTVLGFKRVLGAFGN
jgi:hypothetical protein